MKFKTTLLVIGVLSISCIGCVHLSEKSEVDTPGIPSLKLPSVIGSYMVLQQNQPLPIWGWAAPGEVITVQFENHSVKTAASEKGEWKIELPPLNAGGPYEMTIQGKTQITLTDILVGDVWVCSGQSNMEMGIRNVLNAKPEIAESDYPNIRLFHVPWKTSGTPQSDLEAKWLPCNPENLSSGGWMGAGFSAVAYFFGRQLHQELNIPIGLIDTSWGGTLIEPWTPPEGFAEVPKLKEYVEIVENADPSYKEAVHKAVGQFEEWIPAARKALDKNQPVLSPPVWPEHPLNQNSQPTGIYNGMIHPLVPFGIRGAIWYQGESNHNDGILYYEKMKALIRGWRKVWNEGDFPFYYVQIAPFDSVYGENQLPMLWEAQLTALSIPNTGMVVTTDIADLNDIHPRNKQDVGKRLALWALAKTYGKSDRVYSGPLYRNMAIEGYQIRLFFDSVGSGLATRDGKAPNWFEVAGDDQIYVEAQAKIEGDSVVVRSDKVPHPVAARMGWSRKAEPNLMNQEGLPASPFRTERWIYQLPKDGAFVRTWNVIGPFELSLDGSEAKGWENALPPEQKVDLEATYPGKENKTITWKTIQALDSGYVDLDRMYPTDTAIAYASVYVFSPLARTCEIRTGSDDSLAIWVNGKEVLKQPGSRGAVPDNDIVAAQLQEGWNEVLLKVADFWGGWGFYFRIIDPNRELKYSLKLE